MLKFALAPRFSLCCLLLWFARPVALGYPDEPSSGSSGNEQDSNHRPRRLEFLNNNGNIGRTGNGGGSFGGGPATSGTSSSVPPPVARANVNRGTAAGQPVPSDTPATSTGRIRNGYGNTDAGQQGFYVAPRTPRPTPEPTPDPTPGPTPPPQIPPSTAGGNSCDAGVFLTVGGGSITYSTHDGNYEYSACDDNPNVLQEGYAQWFAFEGTGNTVKVRLCKNNNLDNVRAALFVKAYSCLGDCPVASDIFGLNTCAEEGDPLSSGTQSTFSTIVGETYHIQIVTAIGVTGRLEASYA